VSEFSLSVPLDQLADAVAERLEERRRWAEIEGVADYLGCSVRRVRDLRERGLPAYRLGKRLLFDLREVDAWIAREGVRV
jgi:excisionase family DNA binding protein